MRNRLFTILMAVFALPLHLAAAEIINDDGNITVQCDEYCVSGIYYSGETEIDNDDPEDIDLSSEEFQIDVETGPFTALVYNKMILSEEDARRFVDLMYCDRPVTVLKAPVAETLLEGCYTVDFVGENNDGEVSYMRFVFLPDGFITMTVNEEAIFDAAVANMLVTRR